MKVKKLLPGGLLTPAMRMLVKASQRSGQSSIGARSELFKNTLETAKAIAKEKEKLFIDLSDKLGPDVVKDLGRNIARSEKANTYRKMIVKVKNNPKFASDKESLDLAEKKLKEYAEKNFDVSKAIIDKDIAKPKLNKDGGFIDMTKDKNYYKGVL